MKILIAEDEIELQKSIVTYLEKDGNICEVASNFEETNYKINLYNYDIAVLDINLNTGSGLDILKIIKKEKKKIPVLIISANSSLEDKLEGLDLGADDYLTKPFHLAELNSRLKAIFRRGKLDGNEIIVFNEININTNSRTVLINDKNIELTKKEFDLLLFFVTNKGRVLSKEIIAEHLWGDNMDLSDNYDFIYVHINNLRRKLTAEGSKYIKTTYGSGYKFID
jgi:DNA-binding response OmpR family regulator